MTELTFLGGVKELGGNKILLEDEGTRVFLDFGLNFDRIGKYFSFPYGPKKFNALDVYTRLGIYPEFDGIYRQDYLNRMGREHEEKGVDGVILSHAHLDHAGGIHFLRPDIDVWTERHSKRILYTLQTTSSAPFNDFLEFVYTGAYATHPRGNGYVKLRGKATTIPRNIKLFRPNEPFEIGSLVIEPFYVDHSLPGACAFIIHTSAGPIVYTGDLRLRGRRKEDTEELIEAATRYKPACLICEGSLIHKHHVGNEEMVVEKSIEFIKPKKGSIIFDCPPRDLDRWTSFYWIARRTGRRLVIGPRQAFLLDLFDGEFGYPKTTHKHIGIYLPRKGMGTLDDMSYPQEFWEQDYSKWERKYLNHKNRVTLEQLRADPGSYILYMPFASVDDLIELEPLEDSVFIRSTPEPYTEEMVLNEEILINWLEEFGLLYKGSHLNLLDDSFDEDDQLKIPQAHVTGHMSLEETARMVNRIRPDVLVPIHTLYPERFQNIYGGKVKIVEPNETLVL